MLFSVHLKATMMKVSRPDHLRPRRARVLRRRVRRSTATSSTRSAPNPANGLASVLTAIELLPADAREDVEEAITRRLRVRARRWRWSTPTAGITNLHVPSDVIIDASMPAAIRSSGQMWNAAGEQQDTKAVIPDSTYAAALRGDDRLLPRARRVRPRHDGHDAQRRPDGAEGRGVRQPRQDVRDRGRRARSASSTASGATLLEHDVEAGDVWRACQTKDAPIADWVRLAVGRARATGAPAVFWLDRAARARRPGAAQGASASSPSSTPTGCRSRSCRSPRPPASRSSGPRAARTRSRSPATCCATTSPTCSPSSSSARARRCSRSCR